MKSILSKFILSLFIAASAFQGAEAAQSSQSIGKCAARRGGGERKIVIPSQKEILAMEELVIKLVNEERAKQNLPPQKFNQLLYPYAKQHSANMGANAVSFGHGGFKERADALFQTKKFRSVGENVAYTYLMKDPVAVSMQGWMKSQGHRENILGNYDETAVGIVYTAEGKCFLTQLFAKRK